MSKEGTLFFFCGKMAAGKSTKAVELAEKECAALLSEDEWLRKLYADEIRTFDDYLKYSARLKPLLEQHVKNLLAIGVSVVMDFPGNTVNQRRWLRVLSSNSQLHYIQASDARCLEQLKKRSKDLPEGSPFTTEAEFHAVNKYFEVPSDDEGFEMIIHTQENL